MFTSLLIGIVGSILIALIGYRRELTLWARSAAIPRFTIRDLLMSTTLIAAGIGALALPFRVSAKLVNTPAWVPLFIGLLIVGCPLIGAGLFLPFGKTRIGVIWGILAMLVLGCLLPAFRPARSF